ncbi:MAG TPA: alpha/beta fold hydrolase [Polyangiaceae bacterium]|nr:alpha/beta fold hydrolase [Polyangiaceae bacterium]
MRMPWSAALGGHYWTLRPFVLEQRPGAGRALAALPSQPWSLEVPDATLGKVRLSGRSFMPDAADRLLLVVHGLGGSAESSYLRAAVLDAHAAGLACLCLNLRGADGLGEDFYHAALSSDLQAALASPELARFRSLHVLGFSLGGHLALRHATEAHDPRLRSVAAICSPLDLQRSQIALDAPGPVLYRRYVLRQLKASYVATARRRPVPTPVERVLRAQTLRRWDELTVVPRFGFGSAPEYYRQASVAPRLGSLSVPALLVLAEHDPMVPAHSVRPALAGASPALDVRWHTRGGHVGFPADLDLGERAPLGLPSQVRSWLLTHSPRA